MSKGGKQPKGHGENSAPGLDYTVKWLPDNGNGFAHVLQSIQPGPRSAAKIIKERITSPYEGRIC